MVDREHERDDRTPPDWVLPGWDAVDPEEPVPVGPGRGAIPEAGLGSEQGVRPGVTAPGTFGLKILKVSEITRAVRTAIRQDPRLLDVWVEVDPSVARPARVEAEAERLQALGATHIRTRDDDGKAVRRLSLHPAASLDARSP